MELLCKNASLYDKLKLYNTSKLHTSQESHHNNYEHTKLVFEMLQNEVYRFKQGHLMTRAYRTVQHSMDIPKLLIHSLHDFYSLTASQMPSNNKSKAKPSKKERETFLNKTTKTNNNKNKHQQDETQYTAQ